MTASAAIRKENKIKRPSNIVIYVVCVILAVMSIFPFAVMFANSTRSRSQIQQNSVSLIPSTFLRSNMKVLDGKIFNPLTGFKNSLIISIGATVCTAPNCGMLESAELNREFMSPMTAFFATVTA